MFAVEQHFVVYVRTCTAPRTPKQPDLMAMSQDFAPTDRNLEKMSITGSKAIAMVDLDHLAVAALVSSKDDFSGRRRKNRRFLPAREVKAVMHRPTVGKGVTAFPEPTRQMIVIDG